MQQPALSSDRVIDPVLTEVARGYGGIFAPVANILFPIVPVGQRAGRVVSFGPEDYVLLNTQRAPGAATKRVQYGYTSAAYGLADHSLEALVPIERMQEAAAVPGIDLATLHVRKVQRSMDVERENAAAVLARNPANYAVTNKSAPTGTDKWDNAASDPFDQVNDERAVIRSKVGMYPEDMVVGPKVYDALTVHPAVLDRLGNASIKVATLDQLQLLFKMRITVGMGVYYDTATAAFVDIWGTDVILAVTTPKSLQDMGSPNFGYTYQLSGYPFVEQPYYEENRKSWAYPVTDAYQPQLVGAIGGYLIQGAVS